MRERPQASGRREQRFVAGVDLAAGERELAAVQAAVGAHDQDEPQQPGFVAEDRHQDGRDPGLPRHDPDSGPLSSS